MPIYEYECLTCGTQFEKRQSFSDAPQAECPNGHDDTRRLLATPIIVFKGSGFYVTDNRGKSSNGANRNSTDTKPETKPEAKSETKGETKSEKKSETSKEAV
jgi:putative FmdB family regulatory protein